MAGGLVAGLGFRIQIWSGTSAWALGFRFDGGGQWVAGVRFRVEWV